MTGNKENLLFWSGLVCRHIEKGKANHHTAPKPSRHPPFRLSGHGTSVLCLIVKMWVPFAAREAGSGKASTAGANRQGSVCLRGQTSSRHQKFPAFHPVPNSTSNPVAEA